jgi:hypothetical protein
MGNLLSIRLAMQPLVGEDLNTKADAQGHRGHLSGNVGDGPVTLMVIQLAEPATINQPCRFK